MPLPDPHAGEMTAELPEDLWAAYEQGLASLKKWTDYVNELKSQLLKELGDAYAGTVDGKKVVAHRPKDQYAITRLREDYPDLTEHFMKWKTEQVFDQTAFEVAHPEILEQYRVRAFTKLGG